MGWKRGGGGGNLSQFLLTSKKRKHETFKQRLNSIPAREKFHKFYPRGETNTALNFQLAKDVRNRLIAKLENVKKEKIYNETTVGEIRL